MLARWKVITGAPFLRDLVGTDILQKPWQYLSPSKSYQLLLHLHRVSTSCIYIVHLHHVSTSYIYIVHLHRTSTSYIYIVYLHRASTSCIYIVYLHRVSVNPHIYFESAYNTIQWFWLQIYFLNVEVSAAVNLLSLRKIYKKYLHYRIILWIKGDYTILF